MQSLYHSCFMKLSRCNRYRSVLSAVLSFGLYLHQTLSCLTLCCVRIAPSEDLGTEHTLEEPTRCDIDVSCDAVASGVFNVFIFDVSFSF